eukprot:gene12645-1732_t
MAPCEGLVRWTVRDTDPAATRQLKGVVVPVYVEGGVVTGLIAAQWISEDGLDARLPAAWDLGILIICLACWGGLLLTKLCSTHPVQVVEAFIAFSIWGVFFIDLGNAATL